jgi:hypothetical protein
VQEEVRSEPCSTKQKDVEDLALVQKMRKGNKKGHKKEKKEDSRQGKKDLSNMICFRCHHTGHYVNQCLEKKMGNAW